MLPLRGGLAPLTLASKAPVPWYLPTGVSAANCIAAYAPEGAASLAASYVNLANPGVHDAGLGVAPAWSAASGWIGDSTKYLTTDIVPAANWSMVVKFAGMSAPNPDLAIALAGCYSTTFRYFSIFNHIEANLAYFNVGAARTYAATKASGIYAIAARKGYIDGVNVTESTSDYTGTQPIYLLAHNDRGTAAYKLRGQVRKVAIYNIVLSDAQLLQLNTTM